MMQGDACRLGISILNNAGNPVTPDDVNDIEITIGQLRKTYSNNELLYQSGLWMFPLSQADTFGFRHPKVDAQVRVAWKNGVIEGKPLYGIRIDESISREVL